MMLSGVVEGLYMPTAVTPASKRHFVYNSLYTEYNDKQVTAGVGKLQGLAML